MGIIATSSYLNQPTLEVVERLVELYCSADTYLDRARHAKTAKLVLTDYQYRRFVELVSRILIARSSQHG